MTSLSNNDIKNSGLNVGSGVCIYIIINITRKYMSSGQWILMRAHQLEYYTRRNKKKKKTDNNVQ